MLPTMSFKVHVPPGSDRTPKELVAEWATKNGIPFSFGDYGDYFLIDGNLYKFDRWRITPRQTDSLIFVELSKI